MRSHWHVTSRSNTRIVPVPSSLSLSCSITLFELKTLTNQWNRSTSIFSRLSIHPISSCPATYFVDDVSRARPRTRPPLPPSPLPIYAYSFIQISRTSVPSIVPCVARNLQGETGEKAVENKRKKETRDETNVSLSKKFTRANCVFRFISDNYRLADRYG